MNRPFFTGSDNTIMDKIESLESPVKSATTGSGGSTKLKVGDVLLSYNDMMLIPFVIKTNSTEFAALVKSGADVTEYTVIAATDITVTNGSVKLGSTTGKAYSYIES